MGTTSAVQQYPAQRGFPMDPLIEGYRKFRAEVWPTERARHEALAHWGQSPETMVIACSGWRIVILGHGQCGGPAGQTEKRGRRQGRSGPRVGAMCTLGQTSL
jgi:carbonic anhydrase